MIAPGDLGRINTQLMTMSLGYEMQSRGTDATGIYTCDAKGRWKVRKQANKADVFLAYRYGIGQNAKSLLLHTRAATHGKPHISGNNHPITYGKIIGIHNGVVWNDNTLFRENKWTRIAQVDSEAIFAALNNLDQREALESIDGSWAIAWADTHDDPRKLWLCRGSQSPMHYAQTVNGSVVFASTATAVKEAFEYGNISGKPDVQEAKEGFLAFINPDGGLEIQDSPDTSGKNAVGARYVTRNGGGWQGHGYYGGTSWEQEDAAYDEEWKRWAGKSKDDPKIGVREMVKGIKDDPKIGDVRRYLDAKSEWHYERCTWVSDTLKGSSSWVTVEAWEPDKPKSIEPPKEVVLPFVDEAEDFMLGYAEVGDFVTFDKGAVDGGPGHFGGYVTDVAADGAVLIELRPAWFDQSAAYMIAYPSRKEEAT